MNVVESEINGKKIIGYEIPLQNVVFIMVKAEKGFLMCGYLNLEVAEKFGDAACIVKGIKTVEDMFSGKVFAATKKAKELGIKEGMIGREALVLMS